MQYFHGYVVQGGRLEKSLPFWHSTPHVGPLIIEVLNCQKMGDKESYQIPSFVPLALPLRPENSPTEFFPRFPPFLPSIPGEPAITPSLILPIAPPTEALPLTPLVPPPRPRLPLIPSSPTSPLFHAPSAINAPLSSPILFPSISHTFIPPQNTANPTSPPANDTLPSSSNLWPTERTLPHLPNITLSNPSPALLAPPLLPASQPTFRLPSDSPIPWKLPGMPFSNITHFISADISSPSVMQETLLEAANASGNEVLEKFVVGEQEPHPFDGRTQVNDVTEAQNVTINVDTVESTFSTPHTTVIVGEEPVELKKSEASPVSATEHIQTNEVVSESNTTIDHTSTIVERARPTVAPRFGKLDRPQTNLFSTLAHSTTPHIQQMIQTMRGKHSRAAESDPILPQATSQQKQEEVQIAQPGYHDGMKQTISDIPSIQNDVGTQYATTITITEDQDATKNENLEAISDFTTNESHILHHIGDSETLQSTFSAEASSDIFITPRDIEGSEISEVVVTCLQSTAVTTTFANESSHHILLQSLPAIIHAPSEDRQTSLLLQYLERVLYQRALQAALRAFPFSIPFQTPFSPIQEVSKRHSIVVEEIEDTNPEAPSPNRKFSEFGIIEHSEPSEVCFPPEISANVDDDEEEDELILTFSKRPTNNKGPLSREFLDGDKPSFGTTEFASLPIFHAPGEAQKLHLFSSPFLSTVTPNASSTGDSYMSDTVTVDYGYDTSFQSTDDSLSSSLFSKQFDAPYPPSPDDEIYRPKTVSDRLQLLQERISSPLESSQSALNELGLQFIVALFTSPAAPQKSDAKHCASSSSLEPHKSGTVPTLNRTNPRKRRTTLHPTLAPNDPKRPKK